MPPQAMGARRRRKKKAYHLLHARCTIPSSFLSAVVINGTKEHF
jgi:hypothetical protein